MLRHSLSEQSFNLSVLKMFAQLLDGGNADFLVDAQHLLGIKPRILADTRKRRAGLLSQLFQLPEFARQYDLPNRARDALPYAGITGKVHALPHEFVKALR